MNLQINRLIMFTKNPILGSYCNPSIRLQYRISVYQLQPFAFPGKWTRKTIEEKSHFQNPDLPLKVFSIYG